MMTTRTRWFSVAVLIALSGGAVGAGPPKVPEGFEVRLIAAVPAIHFPSQVATAPGGALFIAEDPMDQTGPYESKNGKILILRDGKAPEMFAEGFRAIFGMTWHDGALYVSHMPFLTVLRDDDGDGKVDSRKDLFTDLGITDNKGLNDHIVSGLQFGIDGRLYIAVGDKGVLQATGPDGKTAQIKGGGMLRCRADGTGIEVLTTGTRNHLEPNLDAKDNLFSYDNTDDGDGWWTRVTHHIDGGYYGYPYDYHKYPDRFLNRISEYAGGSPTGGLVYREDAWPEQYRGRVFWAEWGKRKVQAFQFEPSGASFRVADVLDFTGGDASNFHPIDLALSYDGKTMYVADWGMGGWGSKTEKVGTVFAITYKGPEVATRPRGADADPLDAQFRQLDHPSYNERTRAQSAIIRAGQPAFDQAVRQLGDEAVDPVARRHLVWIVDAIGGDSPAVDALMVGLSAKVDDVRAQAARALGERRRELATNQLILRATTDFSPAVRLQAIIALGRLGQSRGIDALLLTLTDPDRTLGFAARQALRRIGNFGALDVGLRSPDPQLRAATLATLELVFDYGAVAALRSVVDDPNASPGDRARALGAMALVVRKTPPWDGKWWGTRPSQGKSPAATIDWDATPEILQAIESSLADPAAAVRLAAVAAVVETTDRAALPALRARFNPAIEAIPAVLEQVALALGRLHDQASIAALVEAIKLDATPESVRVAALTGLETIGGEESARPLVELLRTRGDSFPAASLARVVATLGRVGARDAVPDLVPRLNNPTPEVRAATVDALGRIGPASLVAGPVRDRLRDDALDVRKSALAALGRLGDHDSVPAMLALAIPDATRFEATLALADVPDIRALPVYVRGLTDKSQDIRKATAKALTAIRDEAAPALERVAARHELSPSALPELRKVFHQFRPVAAWHLLGAFPLDTAPTIAPESAVDLAATVPGADGASVAWKATQGDHDHGTLDLARFYAPETTKKSTYGSAEIDSATNRSARMMVGCDDRMTVWLNGDQVRKIDGNHTYAPDMAEFAVKLKAGKNLLLVRSDNDGGDWKFSVAVTQVADYAFLQGPAEGAYNPDKHRNVALAGKGKPDHGKTLFSDLKGLACVKCHAVNGEGGAIGPNLSGIASMYPRDELITSILSPSARIFSGYETTIVALNDGRTLTGLIKSDTPDGLELEDADGKRTKVTPADVEERKTSDVSLMPSGLVEGISPGDFADLIAYLETLKNAAANQGMPGAK